MRNVNMNVRFIFVLFWIILDLYNLSYGKIIVPKSCIIFSMSPKTIIENNVKCKGKGPKLYH